MLPEIFDQALLGTRRPPGHPAGGLLPAPWGAMGPPRGGRQAGPRGAGRWWLRPRWHQLRRWRSGRYRVVSG